MYIGKKNKWNLVQNKIDFITGARTPTQEPCGLELETDDLVD